MSKSISNPSATGLREADAGVLRIAILGAESSGKSTLAAQLAAHYKTLWVPEFLREFVATRQRVPNQDEQFFIASTQLEREQQALAGARKYLFCDTTPLMTLIYSRIYFQRVDAPLAALASRHAYAATLLTAPDGPWQADGLQRESDAMRQAIHQSLLLELAQRGIPYLLVQGTLEQRMRQVENILPL